MHEDPDAAYGHLIAIGGAEDKELEILQRVFDYAPEGCDEVAVIATGSSIPDEVLPTYQEVFKRLGASHVYGLAVQERADAADQDTIELIRRCGVVFFTGGDQLRLTNVLGGSALLTAIREHAAGFDADVTLLDSALQPVQTYAGGRCVFGPLA